MSCHASRDDCHLCGNVTDTYKIGSKARKAFDPSNTLSVARYRISTLSVSLTWSISEIRTVVRIVQVPAMGRLKSLVPQ